MAENQPVIDVNASCPSCLALRADLASLKAELQQEKDRSENALYAMQMANAGSEALTRKHAAELVALKAERPDEDCDHCHQPFDERGAYCATCYTRALQAFESLKAERVKDWQGLVTKWRSDVCDRSDMAATPEPGALETVPAFDRGVALGRSLCAKELAAVIPSPASAERAWQPIESGDIVWTPELQALVAAVGDFRLQVNQTLVDDISSGFKIGVAACAFVDVLAQKQGGWKPMADAPTDGRRLLAVVPKEGVVVIYYLSHSAGPSCWWNIGGWCVEPTAWDYLPLPPPPASSAENGKA